MTSPPPHILVAGIGNAFLGDDGFGGRVAQQLGERTLPEGIEVHDFGTGGLDLAYEVMRGYDALVLVDISRQGEPPGTLYVMEPESVLKFVKAVGGWPGKVVVVACEPTEVGEMGWGLSPPVEDAVGRAVDVVLEQVDELCTSFR